MQSINYYLKNPGILFEKIFDRCSVLLSDELYLSIKFRLKNGYKLNWKDPKTYNEKLQYLKLYNRRPEYTIMVDKVGVKEYVAKLIGKEYVIPNYQVWDAVEDITLDNLPNTFVMKTSHGGGGCGVYICKDKNQANIQEIRKYFKMAMKQDTYKYNKEWPYKNVTRRILVEKLLVEPGEPSPRDYKVMCFNGEPKLVEFHVGRFSDDHRQDFYDCDWNLTKITQGSYGKVSDHTEPRPKNLEEMLRLSAVLSQGITHCRVDWYDVDGKLYFGEITFFDGSGLEPWDRMEDDLMMGSWIPLPPKTTDGNTNQKGFGNQGIDMFY